MGIFDEVPLPPEKAYLREDLSRVDETWAAARFDSLPHVVHILTSRDRDGELQYLKEQSHLVEDVVDEVVHTYHGGFNKAIQNYSQILRLFSESTESVSDLKINLAESKKRLSARNKQLHQLWYRSVTLRHIISLLDQIEGIAKVPSRIEKLISEKQFYAAVQLQVQSMLMLEREGLQNVGALQDVRSELTKLRGVLFYKILDDLNAHLYNKGDYSLAGSVSLDDDDDVPNTTAAALAANNSQSLPRRTSLLKGDNQSGLQIHGSYRPRSSIGGSFDGRDEGRALELNEEYASNGHMESTRINGSNASKNAKSFLHQMPAWLSDSTPDEFLETIRKSDAPLHIKYLQTMVECLCMLGKVAVAGAMICQRLRPTVHEIIASKIKAHAELTNSRRSGIGKGSQAGTGGVHFLRGQLESYELPKQKRHNGMSTTRTIFSVSPVSPVMAPSGKAQVAARELLDSVLDTIVQIFENHVIVGDLLEGKVSQNVDLNTPKSMPVDVNWNTDSDASQVTGGYSIGFSLTVLQSECQQLICEILRATPEAASADAAAQTARLASKVPSKKEKKDGSEDGFTFAFRFTDATVSITNQGWNRKSSTVAQEGYGSAAVLPEQGIYLAASLYRPVLQFTEKIASMLPTKHSQFGNDGLLAFMENFVKDRFLPTMFVDYRKGVQQAISSPAAFRPRAHAISSYTPSIKKGRPVLQGLLAVDFLTNEVIGWAKAMPKFGNDLVKYAQTFLERTYERCRTSYMEAVLEKQSYMLIGRYDIEKLMKLDPSSACLPEPRGQFNRESNSTDAETVQVESEISKALLDLRPIKQENLILDDSKLILLASLSDSLEYVAESIERLGEKSQITSNEVEAKRTHHRTRSESAPSRSLASFAEDYRRLAIDCLKEMTNREYLDDADAEEPDDFIISLTSKITRTEEEMAPFVSNAKRNYIFGGICGVAANASIQALADVKSINLFGVQQICRNSIALEQALAAIPCINSEAVQQRLDHVRTYYELLNMPFEALLAFIAENVQLFSAIEYGNLLKVQVQGREIPPDAQDRLSEILPM